MFALPFPYLNYILSDSNVTLLALFYTDNNDSKSIVCSYGGPIMLQRKQLVLQKIYSLMV